MTSSPVDFVLLFALVLTSGSVILTWRKLKRLDAYHADYQRIFAQTAAALRAARAAVDELNTEGRQLVATLSERIDQANALLKAMEPKPVEQGRRPTSSGAILDIAALLRARPHLAAQAEGGERKSAAASER
jgi:hypothetical protein